MPIRTAIKQFQLANPLYAGATVEFFTVTGGGISTGVRATLYEAETGVDTVTNPQTLDSEGKFENPVYIEVAVIGSVSGISAEDHETGIIYPTGSFRGEWATATLYYPGDIVVAGADADNSNDVYVVNTRHTSAVFSTDVSNDRISLFITYSAAALATLGISNTTNPALGDALVGCKRILTDAVAFTLHDYHEYRAVNVKTDFGCVGDGSNETTKIQKALDSMTVFDKGLRVELPYTVDGYGIATLAIKNSNTHLVGVGGQVRLKYLGTGGNPMIRMDKSIDHAGDNYQDVLIENIYLDGQLKALFNLYLNGFTRRCTLRNVWAISAVCPLYAINSYYGAAENCEFGQTCKVKPSEISAGEWSTYRYGTFLNVCHAFRFTRCIWFMIGGNSANSFSNIINISQSEGVTIDSFTVERCDTTLDDRYVNNAIELGGSTTLRIANSYFEEVRTSVDLIKIAQNSAIEFGNLYINQTRSPVFVSGYQYTPISFGNIYAEQCDFSDRLFKVAIGTGFFSVKFNGATSFFAGGFSGATADPTGTGSTLGFCTDPILIDNRTHPAVTGYVKLGYAPSISGDYIHVSSGDAVVNGQSVQLGRNSGIIQRLVPDLTVADTWDVRVSSVGCPFIEKQSAARAGSAYSLKVGQFTTAGGGAAPASLTTYTPAATRLVGELNGPISSSMFINKELVGFVTLVDTGAAADSDLFTLTLSATNGQDDSIGACVHYQLQADGSGLTHSGEQGMFFVSFSQDGSSPPVRVASTPSKMTPAQSLDAGMASITTTFSCSVASNTCTVKAKAETSADVSSRLIFRVNVLGGSRSSASCALSAGVTACV